MPDSRATNSNNTNSAAQQLVKTDHITQNSIRDSREQRPNNSKGRGRGGNKGIQTTPAIDAALAQGKAPAVSPDAAEKMTRAESATHAARARWAGEEKEETKLREFFDKVPVDEGLEILARMRSNTEIAAKTINSRMGADTPATKCHQCHEPKLPNRQWALIKPLRDSRTQGIYNIYFCSTACVARYNHAQQGVNAIPR